MVDFGISANPFHRRMGFGFDEIVETLGWVDWIDNVHGSNIWTQYLFHFVCFCGQHVFFNYSWSWCQRKHMYVTTPPEHAWFRNKVVFHQGNATSWSALPSWIKRPSMSSGPPIPDFQNNPWIAKQSKPHLSAIEVIKTPLMFSNKLQQFVKILCCKVRHPYSTIEMPNWHAPDCEIAPWKSHGLVQRCSRTQLVYVGWIHQTKANDLHTLKHILSSRPIFSA